MFSYGSSLFFSALPFIEPALAILLKCKMKTLNEQLKMSLIYFCGCFNPVSCFSVVHL